MNAANTSRRLAGKVAIVTGAGSGIGRAEALTLAREGAKVVVNDLPRGEPYKAEIVAGEIRAAGGEAIAVSASVSRMESAAEIVRAAVDAFGRLDILVNNAGFGRVGPIWDLTEADWDSTMAVNMKGTFAMVRHAAPVFMQQKNGVIVNTASDSGTGDWNFSCYAAAKEGVVGLTRAIARDLARHGVRCNAVNPRAFDTGQTGDWIYHKYQDYLKRFGRPMTRAHPLGPIPGRSMEVAALVTWLCTDEARDSNGRLYVAGCGEVGIYDEVSPTRAYFSTKEWTLDEVSSIGPHLLAGVRNEFVDLPQGAYDIIDERASRQIQRFRKPQS